MNDCYYYHHSMMVYINKINLILVITSIPRNMHNSIDKKYGRLHVPTGHTISRQYLLYGKPDKI